MQRSGARSDYDLVHGIRGFDRGGHRQRYGPQCAKALGMTMGVFYSTVSHARAGINSKYTFYVEKLKKEDFSE